MQQTTPHSITSSAVASSSGGTVRPSAFAVLRLMAKTNLVGWKMGMSAGLAPLRIWATMTAALRPISGSSAPKDMRPPCLTNTANG